MAIDRLLSFRRLHSCPAIQLAIPRTGLRLLRPTSGAALRLLRPIAMCSNPRSEDAYSQAVSPPQELRAAAPSAACPRRRGRPPRATGKESSNDFASAAPPPPGTTSTTAPPAVDADFASAAPPPPGTTLPTAPPAMDAQVSSTSGRRRGRPSTRIPNPNPIPTGDATTAADATQSQPQAADLRDMHLENIIFMFAAIAIILAGGDLKTLRSSSFWKETMLPRTAKEGVKWMFPEVCKSTVAAIIVARTLIHALVSKGMKSSMPVEHLSGGGSTGDVTPDISGRGTGDVTAERLGTDFMSKRDRLVTDHSNEKAKIHAKYVEDNLKADTELGLQLSELVRSHFAGLQ